MKVVYLAGPYRADTEYGVHKNIQLADKMAIAVWKLGAACLSPHKNAAYFGGACPDAVWLLGGLEMLRRCDAVLVMECDLFQSTGTQEECALANKLGMPLFVTLTALYDWLQKFKDRPTRCMNCRKDDG